MSIRCITDFYRYKGLAICAVMDKGTLLGDMDNNGELSVADLRQQGSCDLFKKVYDLAKKILFLQKYFFASHEKVFLYPKFRSTLV